MQKLKRIFLEEIYLNLKEDISREDKWRQEEDAFIEIIKCFELSKKEDLIDKTTLFDFYEEADSFVFKIPKFDFVVCFALKPVSNSLNKSFGAFNSLLKILFLNVYKFGILKTGNFLTDKEFLLNQLKSDTRLKAIIHHELAHKFFSGRFSNLKADFNFKKKDSNLNYFSSKEEYNSILSEIYDFAIKTKKIEFNSGFDVFKFLTNLYLSEDPYEESLRDLVLNLSDFKKFTQDLLRFSRNERMKKEDLVFRDFKNFLINNNLHFKTTMDLLKFVHDDKNKETIQCKKLLDLETHLNVERFFEKCFNLIKEINSESKNLKDELLEKKETKEDKKKEVQTLMQSFISGLDPQTFVYEKDLPQIKSNYLKKRQFFKKLEALLQDDDFLSENF